MYHLFKTLFMAMATMFLLHHVVTADEFDQKVRLLFVGDIMLDNGPGHLVSNGHDPFLPCADLLLSADLTIGNLECVVGKGGEQLDKPYTFRAASDSPRYLKKYFDALSLANNHSWDYGADGFSEALRVLKAERIAYFGGGNNLREARAPLVLECKGRKLGLLGYNEFRASNYAATDASAGNAPLDERSMISDIVSARKKFGCEIVIPFLHWGEELLAMPRKDQRELAEKLIDAGATAVIGAHPHVTQTIDIYRGAPIFYSLGNFVFDYFPGDPPEWIGWAVALEISGDGHVDFETTVVKLDPVGVPHLARQE